MNLSSSLCGHRVVITSPVIVSSLSSTCILSYNRIHPHLVEPIYELKVKACQMPFVRSPLPMAIREAVVDCFTFGAPQTVKVYPY